MDIFLLLCDKLQLIGVSSLAPLCQCHHLVGGLRSKIRMSSMRPRYDLESEIQESFFSWF